MVETFTNQNCSLPTSLCVRTFGYLRGAAPSSPNPAIAAAHSWYVPECAGTMSAAAVFVVEECRYPKVPRRASSPHRWWMSCKGAITMAVGFRVRPHMIVDDDWTRFAHSRTHTTDLLYHVPRSASRSVMQVVTAARRSFAADRLDHRQSSYYDGRRPQGT